MFSRPQMFRLCSHQYIHGVRIEHLRVNLRRLRMESDCRRRGRDFDFGQVHVTRFLCERQLDFSVRVRRHGLIERGRGFLVLVGCTRLLSLNSKIVGRSHVVPLRTRISIPVMRIVPLVHLQRVVFIWFQLRNLHGRVPGFVSYNAVCVMSGVRPSRGIKLNTIDGFGVGRVSVQSAVGLRRLMVRLARVGRVATRDSLQKSPSGRKVVVSSSSSRLQQRK